MAVLYSGPHHFVPRPTFARQRSNSMPIFSLANVSDEEAGILFSAAERATARRRRPVSVDSPGPAVTGGYDQGFVPKRTFNFSTPSRFGIGKSPLRHTEMSMTVPPVPDVKEQEGVQELVEEQAEEEEEEPASYEVEPAPIPPRRLLTPAPIAVRSSSSSSSMSSPDPTSPRRQVANQNLKAYADGLLRFTQSRLNTVAPQILYLNGPSSDSSFPPTPELEQDVMELRFERPTLRSHFSNWSSTTTETADDDGGSRQMSFASSTEPRTPDEESGMISPDSFFNEATPRVRQATEWTGISSARPSSRAFGSPIRQSGFSTSANTNSESFSYFSGFDSVSAAASSQFSLQDSAFDFEILRTPGTPAGIASRSRPTSSASGSVPFRRRTHTPLSEGMGISRPPSWLVRAIG